MSPAFRQVPPLMPASAAAQMTSPAFGPSGSAFPVVLPPPQLPTGYLNTMSSVARQFPLAPAEQVTQVPPTVPTLPDDHPLAGYGRTAAPLPGTLPPPTLAPTVAPVGTPQVYPPAPMQAGMIPGMPTDPPTGMGRPTGPNDPQFAIWVGNMESKLHNGLAAEIKFLNSLMKQQTITHAQLAKYKKMLGEMWLKYLDSQKSMAAQQAKVKDLEVKMGKLSQDVNLMKQYFNMYKQEYSKKWQTTENSLGALWAKTSQAMATMSNVHAEAQSQLDALVGATGAPPVASAPTVTSAPTDPPQPTQPKMLPPVQYNPASFVAPAQLSPPPQLPSQPQLPPRAPLAPQAELPSSPQAQKSPQVQKSSKPVITQSTQPTWEKMAWSPSSGVTVDF